MWLLPTAPSGIIANHSFYLCLFSGYLPDKALSYSLLPFLFPKNVFISHVEPETFLKTVKMPKGSALLCSIQNLLYIFNWNLNSIKTGWAIAYKSHYTMLFKYTINSSRGFSTELLEGIYISDCFALICYRKQQNGRKVFCSCCFCFSFTTASTETVTVELR